MPLPVIILAGGLATRMRPATETVPKALLPVNGRPFADIQLAWLRSLGVTEVVYSIGYLGEAIVRHVGDGERFGLAVRYAADGERPLGTAGALRAVIDAGLVARSFSVINGDSYLSLDLPEVEDAFARSGCPALMTVMRNRNRWDASNAVYRNGRVVVYDKTRPEAWRRQMEWIDYGFAVLSRPAVTDRVVAGGVAELSDLMHDLSAGGQLAGHEVFERFYEIGSPRGLADLERHLASRVV
ncbi:MAG: sugar phosphate nucleotidyltransferase [Candidatus Dormibacteria bacterium]|jgi:NDP-sugar pyrophosphorylase family protein